MTIKYDERQINGNFCSKFDSIYKQKLWVSKVKQKLLSQTIRQKINVLLVDGCFKNLKSTVKISLTDTTSSSSNQTNFASYIFVRCRKYF